MIKKILQDNWNDYKKDLHPKDRRMNILYKKGIGGLNQCMSTENIMFFINEIVKKFAKNGTYLEVGIYRGCSLLSAALFNPSTRCIGIDNFSQFNYNSIDGWKPSDNLDNVNILKENLKKFDNPKNIEVYNMDYREAIDHLFSKDPNLKVNVYYYDGKHSYENQLEGLRTMLPYLAEKCIIFVDDINWKQVERANNDFLKENPDFRSVFKIKTVDNWSEDWWNGFEVIVRGI